MCSISVYKTYTDVGLDSIDTVTWGMLVSCLYDHQTKWVKVNHLILVWNWQPSSAIDSVSTL